jgi:sugar phosphate isomerase/epimerase
MFHSIYDARRFVRHMHTADVRRGVPGAGSIDFVEMAKALKAIDYRGQLVLETLLLPDAKTAITKGCKYLNCLCNELL